MPSIAEALRAEMLRTGAADVWAGDPDLCLTAYENAGGTLAHPLNRIKATIDAARRSPLFVRSGYIRACDSSGTREILHPCFTLKELQPPQK